MKTENGVDGLDGQNGGDGLDEELSAKNFIVVENAPLGVKAGVAARILTVAVNTGPLDRAMLEEAGADLVFDAMTTLANAWPRLWNDIKESTQE